MVSHDKFEFHSNLDIWPTLQPKIGQTNFSALWPKKLYTAFIFGTHTQHSKCLELHCLSSWLGNFGHLVAADTQKGDFNRAPPPAECFLRFFICDQAALRTLISVCLSVRLSVRHTLLTMFLSLYHPDIFRTYYHWQMWPPCKRSRSEVNGQGHRCHDPT